MYVNHPCKLGILANKFELSDFVFYVLNDSNEIWKQVSKLTKTTAGKLPNVAQLISCLPPKTICCLSFLKMWLKYYLHICMTYMCISLLNLTNTLYIFESFFKIKILNFESLGIVYKKYRNINIILGLKISLI